MGALLIGLNINFIGDNKRNIITNVSISSHDSGPIVWQAITNYDHIKWNTHTHTHTHTHTRFIYIYIYIYVYIGNYIPIFQPQ